MCEELRTFFIENILETGGHFSGNLGVVELTVALHYVFDIDSDKLVWDVGHQSYIHKILTGRKNEIRTIRKHKGLSGFPNISESTHDHFGTGHSSTSISAAMGMAAASQLKGIDRQHIAVIGDGSLTGGMAFEALNNLGVSNANVLVIVNDNQIGIDPNLGAINRHLNKIDPENNIFTSLDLAYSGPLDGHDVIALVNELEYQKCRDIPRVLHINTIKGKGFEDAEKEQTKWHSVKYVKIDPAAPESPKTKYQDVFGQTLLELADSYVDLVAITPAMPSGSSLDLMMQKHPERVFDVGIAEQHAVTFAAGLAKEGAIPFCVIYSSFAQRAYDQIIHDVALQNLPVVLCLDRAGLVGEDGATHHGVFDIAFLRSIPNLTILSPMDASELRSAMHFAVNYRNGPIVIRYPKGKIHIENWKDSDVSADHTTYRVISPGSGAAMVSVGSIGLEVQKAISKTGKNIHHIDLRCIKPLNQGLMEALMQFDTVITVEEGVLEGGIGEAIVAQLEERSYQGNVKTLGIPDKFIEHGSIQELREEIGLSAEAISKQIKDP